MYAIKRSLVTVLALPLLLSVWACDKEKSADGDTKKAEEKAPPKVEKKDPETLFTGDEVTMPATYGAIALGMTLDEAKAAMAELPEDGTIESKEYPDIGFHTDFDDDSKKLERVYFNMSKPDAIKFATAKWGAPQEGMDMDEKVQWWFNAEGKLRVSVSDSYGDGEAKVEFTSYLPAAELLGAAGKELGFEKDAPLLGLSVAELEAKYTKWVKKESEEEAKKSQDDIEKLAGAEAKALMGKPTASIDLEYPPTEWGSYWTPVHLTWSDEGKIERFWFGVDFEAHPAAKDEVFALFKGKWGDPKEEDDYGDKMFVFSDEPRIEVKEDTISGKWDIFVEVPGR